jgi:sugar lactone lactonase YvrE
MRNKLSFKSLFACGFALTSVAVAHAQSLTINTFAGHDVPGSKDGLSSSARFSHPNSLAADSAGSIYVADTENSTIRKITPNGSVSTFAGFAGNFGSADGVGTNANFYGPQGIAVDNAGFIYVADTANSTIRKITPAGVVSTFAGSVGNVNSFDGAGPNANFNQPRSLAVDNGGNVYVADTGNHTIRKITPAGLVTTLAGLAGNPGGANGTNSKARFNCPSGIAVDSATNLFVADFNNHTIRKITLSGTVSTIAGLAGVWGNTDGTNSAARFFQPQGIVADNAGNLFVADSGNQVIRKISPSGTNWVVTTVAGFPGIAGNTDGTNNPARFYFPTDVAQDSAGYLYISDLGNNAIRTERIVPPTLQLAILANQFIFSWPVSASGFVLETAHNVSPSTQWTPATNSVIISGDQFVLTNNPSITPSFYRLHHP